MLGLLLRQHGDDKMNPRAPYLIKVATAYIEDAYEIVHGQRSNLTWEELTQMEKISEAIKILEGLNKGSK